MPRLTHIVHPFYGRIKVNTATCPVCGSEAGDTCSFQCPLSPVAYTPEREREDALTTEAEIAAVGFMAWDSEQHRRHGLPCPYDGYEIGDSDWDLGLGEIDAGGA